MEAMENPFPTTYFGTTTLGHMLDAMADMGSSQPLAFDFCGVIPDLDADTGGVKSYRGWNEHLAISWRLADFSQYATVYGLRRKLAETIGATMDGYKGITHRPNRNTPVWVDNRGEAHNTAIIGWSDISGSIVLHTKAIDT